MKNIIYGLIDPFTLELHYIGKSTSGMNRPREHFKPRNLKNNSHKTNWVKTVLSKGSKPEIMILEEFSDSNELSEAEKFWIAYYRGIGCRLTNLTDGGEGNIGWHPSPETIEKLRKAALERDQTPYKVPHNKKDYSYINNKKHKECSKCKIVKHIDNFSNSNNNRIKQSQCKNCNKLSQREWKLKNPSPKLSKEEYNKTRIAGAKAGGAASKSPESRANLSKKLSKAVQGTNIHTGEIIKFASALEAKNHGFQNSNIGQAIRAKKPYRNYFWQFI